MAYDELLVDRVKQRFLSTDLLELKKMMGGIVFMLNGKMCLGVDRDKKTGEDRLMLRVGKERYENYLTLPGCRLMDFTGKPMKGFIYVYPEGFDLDKDLDQWVEEAKGYVNDINKLK